MAEVIKVMTLRSMLLGVCKAPVDWKVGAEAGLPDTCSK